MPRATVRRAPTVDVVASSAALLAAPSLGLTLLGLSLFEQEHDRLTDLSDRLPAGVVPLIAAGLALTLADGWLLRSERPAVSAGLSVAVLAAVVPTWASWTGPAPVWRAAALAVGAFTAAGLAQVGLQWVSRRHTAVVATAYALATAAAVLQWLGYDPAADPSCLRVCRSVPVVLEPVVSASDALRLASAVTLLSALVGLTGLAADAQRGTQTPPAVRVVVGLVLGGLAVSELVRTVSPGDLDRVALAQAWIPCGVALVGLAVWVVLSRILRSRGALHQLIGHLAEVEREPSTARSGAAVQFRVPGEDRWVDITGEEAAEPERRRLHVIHVISDENGPAVRFLLPRGTMADALAPLTPARRLALGNARLTALARARVADTRAAQLRTIQRSDEERRRIERDLHDGAQQRLVTAAFHLSIAASYEASADGASLTAAQAEVSAALERLRRISRGPTPVVLESEGLEAALDELALASDIPVEVSVHGDGRIDPEPEVGAAQAAYLAVEAVLGMAASPSRARVEVMRESDALCVSVGVVLTDDRGPVRLPVEITDRVGALGGHHEVERDGLNLVVKVVVPCGS